MKKFTFFACVAAIALASCGNKAADKVAVENADSIAVEVPAVADSLTAVLSEEVKEAAANPEKVQVVLATIQTKYAELVQEGKLEEAKAYASAVQQYISDNKEAIEAIADGNTTVKTLVEGIINLPTTAETSAEDALKAVSTDATAIVNAAKTATTAVEDAAQTTATQAVEGAKAAAQAKVEETKAAAQAKVDAAKSEAQAQVKAKADEAKAKANATVNKAVDDAAKKLLGK